MGYSETEAAGHLLIVEVAAVVSVKSSLILFSRIYGLLILKAYLILLKEIIGINPNENPLNNPSSSYFNLMEMTVGKKEAALVILLGIGATLSFVFAPLVVMVFLAIAVFIVFFGKIPEIGFILPVFGVILFQPIFLLAGVERALFLFMLIAMGSLISLALSRKDCKVPAADPTQILITLLTIVFFIGFIYSTSKSYAGDKIGIFVLGSLIPFFVVQFLEGNTKFFSNLNRYFMVLALYMIAVSALQFLIVGVGSYERFTIGRGPISYARTMGLTILIGFYSFDREKNPAIRILSAFIAFSGLFFLILGATRGPFLAVGATVIFYIFFMSRSSAITKTSFVLGMFGLVYLFMKKGAFLFARLESTAVGQELSANYRYIMWKTGVEHLFDKPIFGAGTGSFASIIPINLKATGLLYPHNIFLEFMLEWGSVGLVLLVALLLVSAFYSMKLMRWESRAEIGLNGHLLVVIVLYALMNAQISSDISGNYLLWISIGFLAVIYRTKKQEMAHSLT